jgi:hypothetical protein
VRKGRSLATPSITVIYLRRSATDGVLNVLTSLDEDRYTAFFFGHNES